MGKEERTSKPREPKDIVKQQLSFKVSDHSNFEKLISETDSLNGSVHPADPLNTLRGNSTGSRSHSSSPRKVLETSSSPRGDNVEKKGMSRLLFPNQMKVNTSKKKPSTDSSAASIIPLQPPSPPSPLPHSSAEATTNKPNNIPVDTFSAVASNVNILDQIMNGMSQSQMSKKD